MKLLPLVRPLVEGRKSEFTSGERTNRRFPDADGWKFSVAQTYLFASDTGKGRSEPPCAGASD